MKNAVEAAAMALDLPKAIEALRAKSSELAQYASIMEKVNTVDVSADADFQREFNYFYKVRRNEPWRTVFYGLFERCKTVKPLTFSYILRALCAETGNVEASFSSKLLSALNPDMPIWDSIVLCKLGMKPSQSLNKEERLTATEKMYQDMVSWYQEFCQSEKAQEMLGAFDCAFPQFVSMSLVKKIDFLLWGSAGENRSLS